MIRKISLFVAGFASLLIFTTVAQSAGAAFDPLEQVCENTNSTICNENDEAQPVGSNSADNPISGPNGIIQKIANIVAIATSVISVIIIAIAGVTMTLSQGDSQKIKSSRDAIIYAVVGIVVVALARTIIIFVTNRIG